jgi:dihydrofolate synthase/folylpolyglutamate synthase
MLYPDSVEYLYALGNEIKSFKLGLDRIRRLLDHLGNPHLSYRVIHVAGTNGKGSVCSMIAAGLRAAGLRTGLYTSPHLLEPTERIRIDGTEISKDVFLETFQVVHQEAEAMLARGELDAHPTYFETLTAMAFVAFREAKVDMAVIEVGLGGRLDATNVVEPELTVITSIGYDHEAWLGHSLASIATEKAGIVKAGVPVLSDPQSEDAWLVIQQRASQVNAPLYPSSAWQQEDLYVDAEGAQFTLRAGNRTLDIRCPLAGAFQAENARIAAAALDLVGIDGDAIERGIRNVEWRGRVQKVGSSPDIYLDGAHNPAGCRALAEFIQMVRGGRKVWLVFGAMRDKAIGEMTEALFGTADYLVLTAPNQARALHPQSLADMVEKVPHTIAPTVPEAIRVIRQAAPEDLVVIAGSLFLVAEAYALLLPPVPSANSDRKLP